jgi:hypothetical protein
VVRDAIIAHSDRRGNGALCCCAVLWRRRSRHTQASALSHTHQNTPKALVEPEPRVLFRFDGPSAARDAGKWAVFTDAYFGGRSTASWRAVAGDGGEVCVWGGGGKGRRPDGLCLSKRASFLFDVDEGAATTETNLSPLSPLSLSLTPHPQPSPPPPSSAARSARSSAPTPTSRAPATASRAAR